MWPPTITDCQCELPGWCERHECYKNAHLHLQCRRQHEMYQRWERGAGPCMPAPLENGTASEPGEPGIVRKVANLGKALVRHVANGLVRLDEPKYQQRLSICLSCESCDKQRMVCLQPACGCRLRLKARWQSEICPLGKWPIVSSESTTELS